MCTYCYDLCACSSAGFLNPMEEIDTTCMVWPSCVFYTLWQASTSSEAIITFMLSVDLSRRNLGCVISLPLSHFISNVIP